MYHSLARVVNNRKDNREQAKTGQKRYLCSQTFELEVFGLFKVGEKIGQLSPKPLSMRVSSVWTENFSKSSKSDWTAKKPYKSTTYVNFVRLSK